MSSKDYFYARISNHTDFSEIESIIVCVTAAGVTMMTKAVKNIIPSISIQLCFWPPVESKSNKLNKVL